MENIVTSTSAVVDETAVVDAAIRKPPKGGGCSKERPSKSLDGEGAERKQSC